MDLTDPLALDAGSVSLHQLATFVKEGLSLADAVEGSSLFSARHDGDVVRAEWVAVTADERLPYPLGRVTLHARGVLLEGFSEARVAELRRQVNQLGSLRLTADETRAFRLEELIRDPARAMHPIEDAAGLEPTARDVARWYLRAAWPYQPCEELDGRTPCAAVLTGRGRKALAGLLDDLGAKLSRRIPDFPSFDAEELQALLLAEPPIPARDRAAPDPAARHSPRRA